MVSAEQLGLVAEQPRPLVVVVAAVGRIGRQSQPTVRLVQVAAVF